MKLTILFLSALLTATSAFALDSNENQNLLEALQQDGNFGTFLDLMQRAEVQLEGEGPFTVFAVTDETFAAMDQQELEAIQEDQERLRALLENHILEGAYTVNELQDAAELTTLAGEPLQVDIGAGGLTVNSVGLDSNDVDNTYANGVVHVAEGAILPAAAAPTPES